MSTLPTAVNWALALLGAWALVWNAYAFSLMGIDKDRARKRKRRIPEKWLFFSAALGGSLGALLGMRTFRHKTLHRSFTLGMPLLLILNIAMYGFVGYMVLNS